MLENSSLAFIERNKKTIERIIKSERSNAKKQFLKDLTPNRTADIIEFCLDNKKFAWEK